MTIQAENNIKLCKGQSKKKILEFWGIARVKSSVIEELASHYNVKATQEDVATILSKQ